MEGGLWFTPVPSVARRDLMPTLTAMKVAKASYPEGKKGPFLISDGQGLNLQVMPSGSKSWVYASG